jgi:hypothetical protein
MVVKDSLGNIDLGTGKLEADGVVAGAFTVKVVSEESATVGTGTIHIYTDDDLNGIDDNYPGNDGKSVEIKTKAVTETSKIFVTPVGGNPVNWIVDKVKNGEGFTIVLDKPVTKEIKFNWWIVEAH